MPVGVTEWAVDPRRFERKTIEIRLKIRVCNGAFSLHAMRMSVVHMRQLNVCTSCISEAVYLLEVAG